MFDYRIIFTTQSKNKLVCYKNLDYAWFIDSLKFISAFIILIIVLLSHKSKLENIIILLSYKVEYCNNNKTRKRGIICYMIYNLSQILSFKSIYYTIQK